jgi:hypothetical protein
MAELIEVLKQFMPSNQAPPVPPGVNPQDWERANLQTNLQYGGQESNVYDQLDTLQQFLGRDVDAQQKYGLIQDKNLADVASQLGTQLHAGTQATEEIFKQGVTATGGVYDELAQTLGKTGEDVEAALTTQAGRLGQRAALTGYENPLSRIQAEVAGMKGRAATSKAGALSNLISLGAQMQGIAQSRESGAATEFAQRRGNLASSVQSAITKLQLQAMGDTKSLLKSLSTIVAQKGLALQENLNALQTARSEAEREAIKDQIAAQDREFDNMIKLRDMALKESTAETKAATAAAEAETLTSAFGSHGLTVWMKDTNQPGKFKGMARRFIDDAVAEALDTGDDPYKLAMSKIQGGSAKGKTSLVDAITGKTYEWPQSDLASAVQIYFNKFGGAKKGKTAV